MNKNNEILGKEYKCLDKGFVRLIDYMGDDAAIVQAARVSYGKGTKSLNEDRGLIRYLMRHRHTSPFEMVEFKFHVKLPIFVARQWIRHRTANVNEYSGRYSEMKNEFYIPELEQLRPQSTMNKQGREDQPLEGAKAAKIQSDLIEKQNMLFDSYSGYIEDGLARELARINLPLSNYTEWYWKIDLHNLFHFLRLRMDSHAQYEIQVYGEIMAEMVKAICPHAYEAFEDFSLNSAYFSGSELKALKSMINTDEMSDELLKESGLSPREAREFKSKLDKILKNK
jgi:thymidylate synthase (FAD)